MAVVAFDTHAYIKKLKAAGVPEEQAEVHAETIAQLIEGELATKRDIEELRQTMKRDIEEFRQDTKRDIEALRLATQRDIEELRQTTKQAIEGLRRDMKELEITLRRDMADTKADMLKWTAGLLVAQAGFIIAAVKLL